METEKEKRKRARSLGIGDPLLTFCTGCGSVVHLDQLEVLDIYDGLKSRTIICGGCGHSYDIADGIDYYSDRRLKTNIRVIDNAIDKVKKLGGYYYNPNDLAVELKATDDQDERVGVMAQEVMEVLPHAVKDAPFDRTGTYKTVQYEKLVPLLIQAIKEQQTQIEELKTLIHGLTE